MTTLTATTPAQTVTDEVSGGVHIDAFGDAVCDFCGDTLGEMATLPNVPAAIRELTGYREDHQADNLRCARLAA